MIKTIIIEDNAFSKTVLIDALKEEHPDIEIMATAENGKEGIETIIQLNPDLIFLDIEMPDMTGFEMLNKLKAVNFKTIFTTAHSHYAIKAFRFNALDYLVKPIKQHELKEAISKYKKNKNPQLNKEQIEIALSNLNAKKTEDQILLLPTQKGMLRIPLKQIIKIEGDRNYSHIYLSNKTKELSSKTLKYFEEVLVENGFFRCHKSFLVNKLHVSKMGSHAELVLNDGSTIPVSRRKKQAFVEWFSLI